MKCVKCGAELKQGCVYCSVCGNEAQMVEDYSVLEDDYLRSLLQEEEEADAAKQIQKKKTAIPSSHKKKMDNRIPILIVCGILIVLIILGIVIKIAINKRNANSYEYQVESAKEEYIDKNYENALHFYKTALSLKPSDVPVRIAMAKIYMEQKEYDAAKVLLMEAIDFAPEQTESYELLIEIYESDEDYESIASLASGIEDDKVLALFEGYIVEVPVISPIGDIYDEYIEVVLFSNEDYDIYYTINGSDPNMKNGMLYTEDGISLEEAGDYEVRAVCINEKGICSDVVEATYEIDVVAPAFATVTPDGGRISDETTVTLEVEDMAADCVIYYTWDGTDPTEASLCYQEPLEIPVGNNILSVLVVNEKTGLDSGVYRTNFIYYP